MIVALGLPLRIATIILGCILSMLLSDFNAFGPISMPTPPTIALTEFFHADTVASVHPLPVSWYSISSSCLYLCSCMQIMSILCSTADAVSSGGWSIPFKVQTLNVAICIVCLHFRSFCYLSSVADFSNTEARAPTSVGRAPFLTRAKSDAVYVYGWSVGQGYLSTAVLFLFSSYRFTAVVPRSNWRSWALSRETHTSSTRLCIAFGRHRVYSHTFMSIMLLPMCTSKKKKKKNGPFFSSKF